jgi:hypothetical protein
LNLSLRKLRGQNELLPANLIPGGAFEAGRYIFINRIKLS